MSRGAWVGRSLVILPILTACADSGGQDILPGHSRPVFEHGWPDPGDLTFEDAGFQPADPSSVLVTTDAGARAYIVAEPSDPMVEVTAAVPLGELYEDDGGAGASALVSRALGQALESALGDELLFDTQLSQSPDLTQLTVVVEAADWRAALGAVVGAVRGLGSGRPVVASATGGGRGGGRGGRGGGGRGGGSALAELTRWVQRSPAARPARATPASAGAFAARALHPESVVFGVGGGVSREEAEAAFRELTTGWTAAPGAMPQAAARTPTPPENLISSEALHTVDEPGFMSQIAIGHGMAPIDPEAEAAVAVMGEVLNIRLNIVTREMRGLTNRAMLILPAASDGGGVLWVRSSSRSESVAPVIRYSVEELYRMREEAGAPTAEELSQVKGGLVLGRWQESLDGPRATASMYASETVRRGSLDHLLGWPAQVEAVTAEDVTAAARKYIQPEAMTAAVVGQIEEVRQSRHPRWPVALDDVPGLLRPGGP